MLNKFNASSLFFLLDKVITKTIRDIVFCFPYIPPETSPYYYNKQFKGFSLLENQMLDIGINKVYLVIAGGLNARTSKMYKIRLQRPFLNLQQMNEVKTILLTLKLCPLGAVCPCPGALYMYKIMNKIV